MPHRTWHPTHEPPTWLDRVLVHPIQTVILGGATLTFGLLLVVGLIHPAYEVSPPVAELHHWQGWLMAVAMVIGGTSVLAAIIAPLPDWEAQVIVERLGVAFGSIGWAMYAAAVALSDARHQGAIVLGAYLAGACVLRLIVIQMIIARRRGDR